MPNRILKESICTSETIDQLTEAEENFFYRLIVNCDDFGRLDARPSVVRAKLYPLRLDSVTDKDILARLKKLQQVGLIFIYEVDGRPYLQVKTWDRHQQKRAKHSKYPSPSESTCNHMISDEIKCPREYENTRNEKREVEDEESRNVKADDCKCDMPAGNGNCAGSEEKEAAAPAVEKIPEDNKKPWGLMRGFEQEFGRPLSPMEIEQINKWGEKYKPEIVQEALRRAVASGILRLRYIDGILLSWEKAGLKTLREIVEYERSVEKHKRKASGGRDLPPDPAKVVQLQRKQREEKIKAAAAYIRLQLGEKPPRGKAEGIAKGYGEDLVPVILNRVYGGEPP